jgi:hypothetical protein
VESYFHITHHRPSFSSNSNMVYYNVMLWGEPNYKKTHFYNLKGKKFLFRI